MRTINPMSLLLALAATLLVTMSAPVRDARSDDADESVVMTTVTLHVEGMMKSRSGAT